MIATINAEVDPTRLPALVVIGMAIFFGTIFARLFQLIRIPQVVGYIFIGLLVGQSGLNLMDLESVNDLQPFSFFALGIIGFLIGGELQRDVFRKHGRQLLAVLFGEGLGAFILVFVLVGAVAFVITNNIAVSIAYAVVLGAIASATAPAATVNVLWESKAAGPLTTTVFAIVALDDALALVLYSIAASIAAILLGTETSGFATTLARVAWELLGGIALGAAIGVILNFVLRKAGEHENALALTIGAVALVAGSARLLGIDMILAAMTLGCVIANLAPRRSKRAFEVVERFTAPMFALFFVTVGAQLNVGGMPGWMWAMAVPYLAGRTIGKLVGSRVGARLSAAPKSVTRYLGFCLLSQAGVAVGLSITAGHRFGGEFGTAIISIIALTTFVVQIVGPPCVKHAIHLAGEAGLNVTEDDLMQEHTVNDMVDRGAPEFLRGTSLNQILRTISQTQATAYPVTDTTGGLAGVITFEGLKESFGSESLTHWLVAYDLMEPAPDVVHENMPLCDAVSRMRDHHIEFLPVLAKDSSDLIGMLELRTVTRRLSEEVMRRKQLADAGS